MNTQVTIKEFKSVSLKLPEKTSPGPDGFTEESYQTFKKEKIPILYNVFQKTEAERTFYKASITLIPKSDKDIPRKLD